MVLFIGDAISSHVAIINVEPFDASYLKKKKKKRKRIKVGIFTCIFLAPTNLLFWQNSIKEEDEEEENCLPSPTRHIDMKTRMSASFSCYQHQLWKLLVWEGKAFRVVTYFLILHLFTEKTASVSMCMCYLVLLFE